MLGDATTEFANRVLAGILGTYDTWAIYVGDKLGLYRAMRERPSLTYGELSAATGVDARYVKEWIEQQAVTGFVTYDDPAAPAEERRYTLPPAAAEVLTDTESLAFLAPFVRLVTAAGIQLPALLEAYRHGGGVGWREFGEDMRTGQAEMNRPWFLHAMTTDWFPHVPEIHDRLTGGARVADIGCGEGWSSIGLALGYPRATVDGYDLDVPSIEAATAHAAAHGLTDRVTFIGGDAGAIGGKGSYDLVFAFECIHDLAQPVAVLDAMRRIVKPDGYVMVMDERVADEFPGTAGGDVERLMYGFSLFTCLPDGRSHDPSAATGTVMRPGTLEGYARQAGFSGIEVLPIDNDLWRFYRLLL